MLKNKLENNTYNCYTNLMEIRQKMELRRLLVPELTQSLKILSLPLQGLETLVSEELLNNPFLEETSKEGLPPPSKKTLSGDELDFRMNLLTKKASLQEVLLRQLGMFANTELEFKIGYEIIGNIDDNGYLKAPLEEIAAALGVKLFEVENVLKIIQQFDPPGVAARDIAECLLIQLDLIDKKDPLLRQIIQFHLEDVGKKNYSSIAKALKEPLEKIEPLIKNIVLLNPKPGRNYSQEEIQHIIPDVIVNDELEIAINDEDIPTLNINKAYKDMLKKNNLDPQAKEYMAAKLQSAVALLRAVHRRKFTLRRIAEIIVEIQQEAIMNDLSCLKPLTLQEVAQKLNMHESTVCRAVMNKYVKLPYGIVALKDFFPSHIKNQNGDSLSSSYVKKIINGLIDKEDKKHPLSDQDVCGILSKDYNLNVSRRTVAKYREELKILATAYRRER